MGKAATGLTGQGGLGAAGGAFVADSLGVHGASRAAVKMGVATGCQKTVEGAGRAAGLGKNR